MSSGKPNKKAISPTGQPAFPAALQNLWRQILINTNAELEEEARMPALYTRETGMVEPDMDLGPPQKRTTVEPPQKKRRKKTARAKKPRPSRLGAKKPAAKR